MGHKRKDTVSTKPVEWAKHLRPFEKRRVAKSERRAIKKEIEFDEPHIFDVDECGRW